MTGYCQWSFCGASAKRDSSRPAAALLGPRASRERVQMIIAVVCQKHQIAVQELRSGSRCGKTAQARAELIQRLLKHYELPLADIACQVGISTSGGV